MMSNQVGYGSTGHASSRGGVLRNGHRGGDEEQPLLGMNKPTGSSFMARTRKVMGAEVSRSWADLVLLMCYVVTGLLDSASTQVWGAFVSMQTGQSVSGGVF
jgi:hypothetical protein